MKTQEELNALKVEIETLNEKLAELSEDELKQVVGGLGDIGGLEYIGPAPLYSNNRPSVRGVINDDKLNFLDKIRESADGRIVYIR